jgi:hypothetical protein
MIELANVTTQQTVYGKMVSQSTIILKTTVIKRWSVEVEGTTLRLNSCDGWEEVNT